AAATTSTTASNAPIPHQARIPWSLTPGGDAHAPFPPGSATWISGRLLQLIEVSVRSPRWVGITLRSHSFAPAMVRRLTSGHGALFRAQPQPGRSHPKRNVWGASPGDQRRTTDCCSSPLPIAKSQAQGPLKPRARREVAATGAAEAPGARAIGFCTSTEPKARLPVAETRVGSILRCSSDIDTLIAKGLSHEKLICSFPQDLRPSGVVEQAETMRATQPR